jgi:hypothetical protein
MKTGWLANRIIYRNGKPAPEAARPARGRSTLAASLLIAAVFATGCASPPPRNMLNACEIFEERKSWYKNTTKSFKKWGVPIHVQLAIIHQESRFKANAKPPRKKLLWLIPWRRASSAYGYAQVKDETWKWYKDKTGRRWADRDSFKDASDFVGWYGNLSHSKLGISKWDAYGQYLAYHEGHGGYKRKTYLKKKWLMKVASNVEKISKHYSAQLAKCGKKLKKRRFLFF